MSNGSAFPVVAGHDVFTAGMTLRDYFATQAMASLIPIMSTWPEGLRYDHVSRDAYEIADEMLAAREQ